MTTHTRYPAIQIPIGTRRDNDHWFTIQFTAGLDSDVFNQLTCNVRPGDRLTDDIDHIIAWARDNNLREVIVTQGDHCTQVRIDRLAIFLGVLGGVGFFIHNVTRQS